jgi:pyrroline-5-carboxylate reductase
MRAVIIGAGNIGIALADGLIKSNNCTAADITVTRRSLASLSRLKEKGFAVSINNAEAVGNAEIIFLCVLPQQLNSVLDEIRDSVNVQKQLIVSVVTGVHTSDIREKLAARMCGWCGLCQIQLCV